MTDKDFEKIEKRIIEIINIDKPKTVQIIVDILKTEYNIDQDILIEYVYELSEKGIITLKTENKITPVNFIQYLKSINSSWYWIIVLFTIATNIIVYIIPSTSQLIFIRYIFSFIYLFYLPGYAITKILYPKNNVSNTLRVIISLALSIGIIYLISLLLNVTFFGLNLFPIASSLLLFILTSSTIGLYIEYQSSMHDK